MLNRICRPSHALQRTAASRSCSNRRVSWPPSVPPMPDARKMFPIARIKNREVRNFAKRAQAFLLSHSWCKKIEKVYLAWAIGRVIGIFFFRLQPTRRGVDRRLWVVVGHLPPAYLVCDDAETWQEALAAYTDEMSRWVRAVRCRRSVKDLIPVNAPPTRKYAKMLDDRLRFIRNRFLSVSSSELPDPGIQPTRRQRQRRAADA